MGWMGALILGICLPIILICLVALFVLPCRRNPVIRQKPQPDSRRDLHRDYRVGGDYR
jgi:hypothetical protein